MRCGYCGCIYSKDWVHDRIVRTARGYFDGNRFRKGQVETG